MSFTTRTYHTNLQLSKKVVPNVLQSFKENHGINTSISSLLCKQMGFHINCKKNAITSHYLLDNFKRLIMNKQPFLSQSLKKEMEENLLKKIKLNTYQGNCLRNQLPSRGQRRRTNASTAKKLLSKIVSKVRR
jgi:ribosomal protein S13